jgi:hypothetical protein
MDSTSHNDNVHPSLLENVTIESLMKLMKFGIWVDYQIRQNKFLGVENVIREELKLYQDYLEIKEDIMVMIRRFIFRNFRIVLQNLQMPTNPSTILNSQNLDLMVSSSMSDAGLCTTLNAKSIEDTFIDSNKRMRKFKEMLGRDEKIPFKPMTISGSGNIHVKKMWLNVRDVTGKEESKGIMSVAINDWKDYVSVRYKK